MDALSEVNTQPHADLFSPELVVQLASLWPSKTEGKPWLILVLELDSRDNKNPRLKPIRQLQEVYH